MDAVEKAYLKELLESLDMFLKPGNNGYNLICDINTNTVFARVGDGRFRIPDEVPEEIRYPLQEMIQCAYDFSRQFESAEEMARYGVEGYRRIGEYCSTVLAAKLLQSGSMEYAVWSYGAGRESVVNGDYFSHLEAAKKRFLIRSGAIPQGHVILAGEQLKTVHNLDDMTQEEIDKLALAEHAPEMDEEIEQ